MHTRIRRYALAARPTSMASYCVQRPSCIVGGLGSTSHQHAPAPEQPAPTEIKLSRYKRAMTVCTQRQAQPRTAQRVADVDGDHGAPDVGADRDAGAQLYSERHQEHVGDDVVKPCRVPGP